MAWWDTWKQPLLGAKDEDSDDSSTNINKQENNKGE